MDNNPLTPKKIQMLMYLAEDKSFNSLLRHRNSENNFTSQSSQRKLSSTQSAANKSTNCELSSGLLDLERCEGFGESGIGNLSLNRSTTSFHPGEMTGRSTGTDQSAMLPATPTPFSQYGRFSEASLQCLEKKLDQQTSDVQQIMRQSIASGYSFHSKRDLTADEVSLVMREAPVNPNHINMDLKETTQESDPIELSMGSYFQNRCLDFKAMLPGTLDSPNRDYSMSLGLNIGEDAPTSQNDQAKKESMINYSLDTSLDSVPVRQPRKLNKTVDIATDSDISKLSKQATENRENIPAPKMPPLPIKKNCFLMDPSKQHLRPSLHPVPEESRSEDDSLSISNIRGLLEKESNADIDTLMKYMRLVRMNEIQALSNLDLNIEANRQRLEQHSHVTPLKDTRKTETASSAGTIDTVINTQNRSNQESTMGQMTRDSMSKENISMDSEKRESMKSKTARSKSPSSNSRSTFSTVQENLGCSSFKSSSSPMQSTTGVAQSTHNSSPNNQYKELDKSVDWQELLQAKGRLVSEGLAKDIWAEIRTVKVTGFVGVSTPAVIAVTSLTDTWLTARLEFNLTEQRQSLSIDLPRFPVLLPPGRTEHFTMQITSNAELDESLPFTLYLKDSSIEGEAEMEGNIDVLLRMPTIQAISSDRVNKVTFPPAQEGMILTRSFVLISDCPVDLQLDLKVTEGSNMFTISAVQEIKKTDVTKQLIDSQPSDDKQKYKTKGLTKQLCRLSSGNAIKVSLRFSAPKLADMKCGNIAVLNGALEVNLIGINVLLKKIDFVATVGTVKLTFDVPSGKVNLSNETTVIPVRNEGTITGTWIVRFKEIPDSEKNLFRLSENKLEIFAGTTFDLKIYYQGPNEVFLQRTLIFEEIHSGTKTQLEVTSGHEAPKVFPIKTSCGKWSWIRNGRKEISLKNFTDKKVYMKCKIVGDAFYVDTARGAGPNTITQLTFAPYERRSLPIVFHSNSTLPCTGALYLTVDRDTESRKMLLYGSSSGEAMCWSGALVTYGNTALVRALSRQPLELTLTNKSTAPAFLSARVHFNLQYRSVSATSRVVGGARVVAGRATVSVQLVVDWGRVERCARDGAAPSAALAAVTLLTGAEVTRRRILKALRNDAQGELDIASLPEHLQQLAGPFVGEDPAMDDLLEDFQEDKTSLDELVKGIHELTAQIDLPQDFPEENTILITDDTVLDHHTLHD